MGQFYEDPLNKNFLCQHCGNAFRTRQGLSGHIQFKHGAKQEADRIDASYLLGKMREIAIWEMACGLPESTIWATRYVVGNWLHVRSFCRALGIDLNKQDFKNYLVASLANVHQNEYLKGQLLPRIQDLLKQAIEDNTS